jgi:hypothetical protein
MDLPLRPGSKCGLKRIPRPVDEIPRMHLHLADPARQGGGTMEASRRPLFLKVFAGIFCAAFLLAGRCEAADGPGDFAGRGPAFRRAMIFSSMGTDFVTFLGMYDAALDAGCPPDLIIGTSGGSVAAVIIAVYPDRDARMQFLMSAEFHQLLLSIHVEQSRPLPAIAQSVLWSGRNLGIPLHPPDLFTRPLASLPAVLPVTGFDIPFPCKAGQPRIITVAGRLDYADPHRLRPGRKLFTETWFTDPCTAALVAGLPSPVGVRYRRSAVAADLDVISDQTLLDGARASVAEAHLFEPVCVAGQWYTGGVIDEWPVEAAAVLACETIVVRKNKLGHLVERVVAGVFEYSPTERKREVDRFPVTFRVDMQDTSAATKEASMWFDIRWVGRDSQELECERTCGLPGPRIVSTVPREVGEFQRRVRLQYCNGYERARRAFARG